jgi:uncharacterized membrane protein YhaH (DUF805 family)
MIQILKNSLTTKYFQFAGRASRKEYWIFYLLFFILIHFLSFFQFSYLHFFISFILIIPSISLDVRRMHDINLCGWWLLIVCIVLSLLCFLVPMDINSFQIDLLCYLISILLGIIPSTPTTNKYGEPPVN